MAAPGPASTDVTVVIASRNRRESVLATIQRLVDLPERPPIILVDDDSTDGTAAAVRRRFPPPQVVVVEQRPHGGVTAARNLGVDMAATPYIAFADDDSWWAPGALTRISALFGAHPRLGLIAARVLVGESQRPDPTCAVMAGSPLPAAGLPGPRVLGFIACGAAVRRAAYAEVGGFCDRYVIGGEEQSLALALAAAGWDLAYVDDVVAHHHPATDDRPGRTATVVRNDLWTAWRLRRLRGALTETAAIIRSAEGPAQRVGVRQALRGLPWALRHRAPIPAAVERHRRMLDRTGSAEAADWLPRVARRRIARMSARIVEHHRPGADPGSEGRSAVVVITYNRVTELATTLRRLRELPERPHVLVVDNASHDGTADMVRGRFPEVELVVLDRNAGAQARNVGVGLLADHPYVAFADDDTWWAPGSLILAAKVLADNPTVGAVTARILIHPRGEEDPIVADMRHSPLPEDPKLPGHPLVSIMAGASMVRRSAFQEVGGFEPQLWLGGEEELLSADLMAAGWQLRYIPELTVHHAPSTTRDAHRRRADGLRNTLWVTWLRRPLGPAAWRTSALLRGAPRDRITLQALWHAVRGVPWVLRERHRLPTVIEAQMQLMDRVQLDSPARRYIS